MVWSELLLLLLGSGTERAEGECCIVRDVQVRSSWKRCAFSVAQERLSDPHQRDCNGRQFEGRSLAPRHKLAAVHF